MSSEGAAVPKLPARRALSTLRVLYEDPHLLVVDKPAGLHTAPLRAGEEATLLAEVISRYPEVASVPGLRAPEHGLLHRLDRETSGVVVFARSPEAFAALREQFAGEAVRKEYRAVCLPGAGGTDAAQGPVRIQSRFAPYGPGRRMVRVVLPESGAAARRKAGEQQYLTEARVLEEGAGFALVGAWLRRGFRHQVRAHLAYLRLPILGDPLYGVARPAGVAPRLYLHAAAVDLAHPLTGLALRIESPTPAEFAAALAASPETREQLR